MEGFAEPSLDRREADAAISFDGILFFDPSGKQLSNVTFSLVSGVEPSASCLLSIVLPGTG
jgi:hypothetical protein